MAAATKRKSAKRGPAMTEITSSYEETREGTTDKKKERESEREREG